jgi:hypothetical protein
VRAAKQLVVTFLIIVLLFQRELVAASNENPI